jgi:hypothetical protein
MSDQQFLSTYIDKRGYVNLPSKKITLTILGKKYDVLLPVSENDKSDSIHIKKIRALIAYQIKTAELPKKTRIKTRAPYLNHKTYAPQGKNIVSDMIDLIISYGYHVSKKVDTTEIRNQTSLL